MGIPVKCEHDGCDEKAVLCLDNVWLCLKHFEEAMARIGRMLRSIFHKPTG